MRRYAQCTCSILGLMLFLGLAATVPAGAAETKSFGKGVTGSETVQIGELLSDPGKFVGKTVRVHGKVTDVCSHRGCWIEIRDASEGKTIRLKVKDGEIVFPVSLKGETLLAEGVFEKLELSKEEALAQAEHEAEEAGKKFDPASVTGPVVQYRIAGTGAVVR